MEQAVAVEFAFRGGFKRLTGARVGSAEAHAARVRYDVLRRVPARRTSLDLEA